MADKNTVYKRRQKIIEALSDKDNVSLEEMMDICNVKRRTLFTDISELKKQGLKISIKSSIIMLENNDGLNFTEPSDKIIMRQVRIIKYIQNNKGITKKRLFNEWVYKEAKNSETDKRRKMLQEDINKLVRKKILSIDSNGIFHLSLDVPVTRKIKNDILLRMIYKIRAKCQGEAYQLILENIIKKMIADYTYKLEGTVENDNTEMLLYESKNNKRYYDVLSSIMNIDYANKKTEIDYRTRRGEVIKRKVSVGTIIFACERDKMYIIASEEYNGADNMTVIDMESIESATESEDINYIYQSDEVQKIIDEMFIVSVDNAENIEVEFKDCFNIKERLEKMAANRKFAKLDISEDKIVYRDTVRGLSDVARYLRGFGRSCKVNKPEKLKQMMIESNDKVIEMYEEYLNKNT